MMVVNNITLQHNPSSAARDLCSGEAIQLEQDLTSSFMLCNAKVPYSETNKIQSALFKPTFLLIKRITTD